MARKRKAPTPDKKTKSKAKKGNGTHTAPSQAAGTTAGSNVGVRQSILCTYYRERYEIEAQIESEKAKHVAPLQEELRDCNKLARNDLDAKAADLNPGYQAYKRSRRLQEIADGGEPDAAEAAKKSQDMMREAFEALQVGGMVDFVTVIGFREDAEADPEAIEVAKRNGREAGAAGKNADHNPYDKDSAQGQAWEEGRGVGMLENVKGGDPFGPKTEATTH